MKKLILFIISIAVLAGCSEKSQSHRNGDLIETHVLHAEDVDHLSPDSVIAILKDGNRCFIERNLHERDAMSQLLESAQDGQHPLAIVLSCIDARVPVETIFDKGLGDIFVTRVAGNVVSNDILGSMEYACEHSGSKVVVVLGHEHCGAVHSACADVQAGNMTEMLAKIKPAIECCHCDSIDHESEEFQYEVMVKNVEIMVDRVRSESEILSHLEKEGKIKIVGAVFNMHNGIVEFL